VPGDATCGVGVGRAHRAQHRGGVSRAAAEAGRHRQVLGEGDGAEAQALAEVLQPVQGRLDQVCPDDLWCEGTSADDAKVRAGMQLDLVGNLGVAVPGTLRGYVDSGKVWIVEWPVLPSNYMIAVTTDGEPALAMREEPEASLRGFNMVAERNDHPWYERQWLRSADGLGLLVGTAVPEGAQPVAQGYAAPSGR